MYNENDIFQKIVLLHFISVIFISKVTKVGLDGICVSTFYVDCTLIFEGNRITSCGTE